MFRTPRHLMTVVLAGSVALAACGGTDGESAADPASATSIDSATAVESATAAAATTAPTSTTESSDRPGPGGGSFTAAPTATHSDLAYATTSASQVLDLWLPADATAATPLVIYVHGGGFKAGDKGMVGGKVQPLLDAGYAVASVNYRLSGEALFPAGAQDVKAAVRWLRANAATYNLDPDRFAAWGESAGGNLVSLLGTTGDQASVLDDPELGNAEVSSAVQAVVSWFGPTDFLQMDTQAASGGGCTSPESHDPASSPESAWMGAAIQTVPDVVAQANPITYILTATRLPAFSIAHGDADCNVPFQQSQILADALASTGGDPELTILPGVAHGGAEFDAIVPATISWLDTVLAA